MKQSIRNNRCDSRQPIAPSILKQVWQGFVPVRPELGLWLRPRQVR
jgi:hypothetical protein